MQQESIGLPKISGLLKAAAKKRESAAWHQSLASTPGTSPRDAHDALAAAGLETRDAKKDMDHVLSNARVVIEIEHLINALAAAAIKSPARTLAQRALEEASDRLRREIGD